nr:FAD:protein FMN transferase [Ruegeria sp. HKCCD6157]
MNTGLPQGRGQGLALTQNGIAQGFAADLVVRALRKAGWESVLVNIGEYYASGRQFLLGETDPVHGLVEVTHLKDSAIATSSPGTGCYNGRRAFTGILSCFRG